MISQILKMNPCFSLKDLKDRAAIGKLRPSVQESEVRKLGSEPEAPGGARGVFETAGVKARVQQLRLPWVKYDLGP